MTTIIVRRKLLAAIGGATAWPLAVRAQQPATPVIGFLSGGTPAGGVEAALAAKAATTTIPIVFQAGLDPVEVGLVTSLNRPGGNITGVSNFVAALVAKQFELLRETVPNSSVIGVLVNPTSPSLAESTARDAQAAGRSLGMQIHILNASTKDQINAAFASFARVRPDALLIGGDVFFNSSRVQLVTLATRQGLPTIYNAREFPAAGGLMSYGASLVDTYRLTGIYVGKILKGAKPAELPVMQPAKFELVINLTTAKALGLTVPDKLLALADEVIE